MFKGIDDFVLLDLEQRVAILTDEDYNLVIAGAGSGKSTTIIGKVKYLVEIKKINPKDILVISFTNKTVEELKTKINKEFNIPVPIKTFHKLGMDILNNKYRVLNDGYKIIENYIKNNYKKMIKFMVFYFDDNPFRKTLKGIKMDQNTANVADFLTIHNLDYKYEDGFVVGKYHIKKYQNKIISFFRNIVYKYLIEYKSISDLSCKLQKNGFDLKIENIEVNNKYQFITFCLQFIQNYKMGNYNFKELKSDKKRVNLFLEIIEDMYNYYEDYLRKNNLIDFEDMINLAKDEVLDINYKYIIIDEYQDISIQRFNLIKKLVDIGNVKIMAVGDDFQSIYAFSGSKIDLFTEFQKIVGYASLLKITNTYRNSQELIDIAGSFVMKNDKQIKKQLRSNKHLNNPIKIVYYDDQIKNLKKILNNLDGRILLLARFNHEKKIILKDKFFKEKNDKIIYIKKTNLDITFLTVHSAKGLGFDNVVVLNVSDGIYGFPSKIKNDEIMDLVTSSYDIMEERRLFYVALTRTKNYVYLLVPKSNPSSFIKELTLFKVNSNHPTNNRTYDGN